MSPVSRKRVCIYIVCLECDLISINEYFRWFSYHFKFIFISDDLRLNTHTTRETKTTHHQQYEDDAKALSPTSSSSRSQSDKNAILSMNMAYDSGGSNIFADSFSIFFLTNFIALLSCFTLR